MPLNINFQQVFLHMLNFALLFGAMYFLLYKPVKKFMDGRSQRYQKMDEDAKAALAQAEAARAEYEKKLAGADDELAQKRADEQDKLRLELEAQRAEAQKTAEQIVEKSRAAAQKEHDAVMAKAQSEIADIVAAAAEKLVLQSTSEAYEQFLTAAEERSSDE